MQPRISTKPCLCDIEQAAPLKNRKGSLVFRLSHISDSLERLHHFFDGGTRPRCGPEGFDLRFIEERRQIAKLTLAQIEEKAYQIELEAQRAGANLEEIDKAKSADRNLEPFDLYRARK